MLEMGTVKRVYMDKSADQFVGKKYSHTTNQGRSAIRYANCTVSYKQ